MTLYSMDIEQLTSNLNVAKEMLLEALEREGLLKGSAKEIGEKYAVIIHKRGWLGSLWAKWFEGLKDEAGFRVTLVKIV